LGRIDIRGSEGQALKAVLRKSLQCAYGITYKGFPNFFTIFGPQTPFANGPLITDYVTDWIGRTIASMKAKGYDHVESSDEVAKKWSDHVNEVYESLVICQSSKDVGAWIVGANVEDKEKTSLFYFGGVPAYANAIDKEIQDGYPGHVFSTAIKAH
jgi:cyclohexanone monooxygenase